MSEPVSLMIAGCLLVPREQRKDQQTKDRYTSLVISKLVQLAHQHVPETICGDDDITTAKTDLKNDRLDFNLFLAIPEGNQSTRILAAIQQSMAHEANQKLFAYLSLYGPEGQVQILPIQSAKK